MNCLQTKLKASVDDAMLASSGTLRIKILKSKGTSCRLGIQKIWDSNVGIKLVGIGTFSNGTQVYELGNQYSYVEVDMASILDDKSAEIHIDNASNIIILSAQTPTLEVVDYVDLKYLNPKLSILGLYNNDRYIEAEDVLNTYDLLSDVSLRGNGIILDTGKVTGLSSLTSFTCDSECITGDINNLIKSDKISSILIYNSKMRGDLAMLPSGLKRFESTHNGQYAGNYTWSSRASTAKKFDIWRINLGDSLDRMLLDMSLCQANNAMDYGYRVYGTHVMNEEIWRNAAQSLAISTKLPVYVNGELFSAN